jgi:outer membrane protein assembly factor BamB
LAKESFVSDAVLSSSDVPFPVGSPKSLAAAPAGERRLRLWPAIVILLFQFALMFVPGWVAPGTMAAVMLRSYGPMLGALGLILWWLFASRLRWTDRLLVPAVFVVSGVAVWFLCHPSFQFGLIFYTLPLITTAWVLWLLISFLLSWPVRRLGVLAVFLILFGASTLVRSGGVWGGFTAEPHWRWTATPEELFMAEHQAPATGGAAVVNLTPSEGAEWPGFRGPQRDGRLTGVKIGTDWGANPPRLVWRHRVGPGWGSFAVAGRLLFTQEQRAGKEAVICYDADSGKEFWSHEDEVRFNDSTHVSGSGPRATPTIHEGKVYALGGTGLLNCLDATTGKVIWSRDAKKDAGANEPIWGFASSPLVWQGLVTVFIGGKEGKSVAAYDAAKGGEPVWQKGKGQQDGKGENSYCSPQPARLGGVEQILIATDVGLMAFHPTKGDILWQYESPSGGPSPRCVQPAIVDDTDVLLGTGFSDGEQRIHIARNGESWETPTNVWTSRKLNAYFNDRVVHKGHVYGFDNNMFTCLSLDKGQERWRGGRYGSGQVLLLPDQDLLLVLSEKGEVILVAADPEKHRELGKFKAIEGKSWNHPVVARGKVFVRNGEEAACYELPAAKDSPGYQD